MMNPMMRQQPFFPNPQNKIKADFMFYYPKPEEKKEEKLDFNEDEGMNHQNNMLAQNAFNLIHQEVKQSKG